MRHLPRVLVVEDDPTIRGLLCDLIADEGYEVVGAADGEAAVAMAAQHPPAAVVLDLMLPGMDGFEVAERLRQSGTPGIIIVSAAHGLQEAAASVGTSHYLAKPYDCDELVAMLAGAAGQAAITA